MNFNDPADWRILFGAAIKLGSWMAVWIAMCIAWFWYDGKRG